MIDESASLSLDNKVLIRAAAAESNQILCVWDAVTGRNVSTFNVNSSASGNAAARPVKTLIFSPDGKTRVTADNADSTLCMGCGIGPPIAALNPGTGNVATAAFTAGGT